MQIPENVNLHHIESILDHLLEDPVPHAGGGAGVVDGAREEEGASVVDHEAPIIIGDSVSLLAIPDHIMVVQESFRGPVEVSWIDRQIRKQLVATATGIVLAYGAHHLMSTGTTDT